MYSQQRSLKAILAEKTNEYLEQDNPESRPHQAGWMGYFQKGWQQVKNKVSSDGRKRADDYLKQVINQRWQNDRYLLNQVVADLDATRFTSKLGTSKKYSQRLLEGICDYLDIQEEEIDALRKKRLDAFNGSLSYSTQNNIPPPPDTSYATLALDLIYKEMERKDLKLKKNAKQMDEELDNIRPPQSLI